MGTNLALRTNHLRYELITQYSDEFDNPIKIEFGISHHSVREIGYATKGSKRHREDIGEVADSVRFSCDEPIDGLTLKLVDDLFFDEKKEEYNALVTRNDLMGFCGYCSDNKLSLEAAFDYFNQEVGILLGEDPELSGLGMSKRDKPE